MSLFPKVTAVVPVHNGREETLAFLDSMARATYPNLKIIVVDDGSTDGTAEAVKAHSPNVIVVTGDGSLWWSGATNVGVREAMNQGTDFVLTINNDNVVEPGFLEPLVETALARPRTLVTSKMFDCDFRGYVCSFGGKIDWFLGEIRDYTSRRDKCNFEEPMECDWVHGSSTIIPAAAFGELGLFDRDNYPQYHGDTEFSLRAKQRGYRLLVEPRSVVCNRTAVSAGTSALNRESIGVMVSDYRSPFYFHANLRLYMGYCPWRPKSFFLAVRYLRLLYSLYRRRFVDKTRLRP
jgi:GT2 family glycosyltransferase